MRVLGDDLVAVDGRGRLGLAAEGKDEGEQESEEGQPGERRTHGRTKVPHQEFRDERAVDSVNSLMVVERLQLLGWVEP